MDNDFNFSSMHFSVLQELGNIGSGNAITSLSTMIGRKIDMSIPKVQLLDFDKVSQMIGGAENPVAAILVNIISENINGIMMFVVEVSRTPVLLSALMQQEIKEELDEISISALKEIGNILTGSYLGALATVLDTTIDMSIPHLTIDMAGSVLSVPAIEFAKVADKAIFIESVFGNDLDGDSKDISGYFILVPDQDSYKYIFNKLGLGV